MSFLMMEPEIPSWTLFFVASGCFLIGGFVPMKYVFAFPIFIIGLIAAHLADFFARIDDGCFGWMKKRFHTFGE